MNRASRPTKTASFAGPSSTMMRWTRSSLRQVVAPSFVVLTGDEPDDVAQEDAERLGVGGRDSEVGDLELSGHVGDSSDEVGVDVSDAFDRRHELVAWREETRGRAVKPTPEGAR